LHPQLTELGAKFVRAARTSADYRLYALPGSVPAKPGLVRRAAGTGGAIAVEVYALGAEALGVFLAGIQSPLGLGRIGLDDDSECLGFVCEDVAQSPSAALERFESDPPDSVQDYFSRQLRLFQTRTTGRTAKDLLGLLVAALAPLSVEELSDALDHHRWMFLLFALCLVVSFAFWSTVSDRVSASVAR
jgi:hypothetical protein